MIRISLCAVSSRTSVQTLQYNKVRAQVYCGVGSSNIYSALCTERKKTFMATKTTLCKIRQLMQKNVFLSFEMI